jgi:LmbE family N-acetylglucosaminyl deacetylase
MARLTFSDIGPAGKVLCLGAHCDDIEIGCGATLVDLAKRWPDLEFHAVIFCSDEQREKEARQSLAALLGDNTHVSLHFGELRDGYLPYQAVEAKEYLVSKVNSLAPDLVFTHSRNDLHQDHRFVGEITYQAIRNSLILEMEIPKYDGDMGRPNMYFPVSQNATDLKISTLMECYPSQADKLWFSEESFRSILRLRGIECRSATGTAEAFYASKVVIS